MSTTIPTLAPNSTWFTQGGTTVTRASITTIEIKDSYTPTGTVTSSWDASAAKDGSIMCYVEGTKLTIAGNGSGKIMANADSSWAFSDSSKKDYFKTLATITGGNLLDTSNATTFEYMFNWASALTSVDVSTWVTDNVTSFKCMFQMNFKIKNLDVGQWNTSKVNTMLGMFNMGTANGTYNDQLTSLDVSNWNTNNVTSMQAMFAGCKSLEELDVSNWNTSSCGNMASMFQYCVSLKELNVSGWDVSNVTSFNTMFSGTSYGAQPMVIKELDVSNWDTSSATDMAGMFYACQGPGTIDISGWNVSKVKNFDHMFAHSYLKIGDTGNWVTSSATNMNALFHTVQNETIHVSKFDTDQVQFFGQMFENAAAKEIIGLENFNTSNVLGFEEMFQGCTQLKSLDLSSFDTSKAKDGVTGSYNGHKTATMKNMFNGMVRLEKITLGENFTFQGNGANAANAAVLPTPSSSYIAGAGGDWLDINGDAYAPSEVPDKRHGTWYASSSVMENDMNEIVLVKKGSLLRTAEAIRNKTETVKGYTPPEFADAILAVVT